MDVDVPVEIQAAQARLRARHVPPAELTGLALAVRNHWKAEVRRTGSLSCTWPGRTLDQLNPKQRALHEKLEAALRAELAGVVE